jgi:hypothetical protein
MRRLISYNENDSYCLFETNDCKKVVFFFKNTDFCSYLNVINEYLFNHIKGFKLSNVATIYKNDKYRGIYFEFTKGKDHVGVFAYCDKRSRNIYHISCYKKYNKTIEIYSIAAQRYYKDVTTS